MIGLLGIGVALILGVAIRPAAFSGALMLLLMYAAVWVPATTAGGQPSGSTNPIVDEHIVGIFGLIVVAALATWSAGVPRAQVGLLPARPGQFLAALRMAAAEPAARLRPAGQRLTPLAGARRRASGMSSGRTWPCCTPRPFTTFAPA